MGWTGLNIGVTGLLSSQKNLYITNNNIANINTDGYSRQLGKQHSLSPAYMKGVGFFGTGTTVDEIRRVRDKFIDFKYWTEGATHSAWEAKKNKLGELENLFGSATENVMSTDLDQLYKALEKLSVNASDPSTRGAVKQNAVKMTKQLNELANKLYSNQKNIDSEITIKIKQVNDYSHQIATLNDEINNLEFGGEMANEFRDQRDLLVDKLSKLVNVNVKEDGTSYTVAIGGLTLVDGKTVSELKYPPNLKDNPCNPKQKLAKVEWDSSGEKVNLKSGEIKALLELRDGDGKNGNYRGVPFYVKRVDEYAQQLVKKFNEIHYQGEGLEGNKNKFFFTANNESSDDFFSGMDYSDAGKVDAMNKYIKENVRADNISVSLDIQNDVNAIAAGKEDAAGVEDNTSILELLKTQDDVHFFDDDDAPKGKPGDFILAIVSSLAVECTHAKRMEKNESVIMDNIKKNRTSVSGVSMDEESAKLIQFQQMYTASAKIITTMDKIYDVTINNLGYVGR